MGRLRVSLAAVLGVVVSQAVAQDVVEHSPSRFVSVSEGTELPPTFVSSMKIRTGDWEVKPLYQVADGAVRVIGLFAFLPSEAQLPGNFHAVWYQRPADDCDEWVVKTWENAKVWDAVTGLKAEYGIPDIQDPLWEVEDQTVTMEAQQVDYERGFAADDPIGPLVNSMPQRDEVVNTLKFAGAPVADPPFEGGELDTAQAWFVNAARFFDATIGMGLEGAELDGAVAMLYKGPPYYWHPTHEVIDLLCLWWRYRDPPRCTPETIYGEWEPDGEACDCSTEGPFCAIEGEFTANLEGEITIHVPWPPPRGTTIRIRANAGATVHVALCGWMRRCIAQTKRTVTRIHADCSRTTTVETGRRREFSAFYYGEAAYCSECDRRPRPADCPPDTEPCGLGWD